MIYGELTDIVGKENISDDELDKTIYSVGRNWYARTWMAQGCPIPKPDFIVYPNTVEKISDILILANREEIPVIPFGGGSSGMGGTLPFYGGILIDVKKLEEIKEINERSLTITTQTGISCWKLEDELNRLGYTSGHLPASHFCACLGGFIALRSAGRLSTKYGKIEDMILGLEVVLPTGKIIRTKAVPGRATGPDLNQLFIGSEGTLGIVTEAVMKIHPLPEERRFRAVVFPNLHNGIEAMRKIMQKGLVPCLARLYDEVETTTVLRDTWGVEKKGACLIIGFDGLKEMVDIEEKVALEICAKEEGEDLSRELGEYWWAHRYDDYYPTTKSLKMYKALLGGFAAGGTADTCATYDKLEELYFAMKEAFEKKYAKKYKGWFHAHLSHWYKSGAMIYPRWYLYEIPNGKNLVRVYNEVWNTLIRVFLEHGGVINHHHGIGRLLARFLKEEYGLGFEVLEEIKRALDPNNIMNPGVLGLGGR